MNCCNDYGQCKQGYGCPGRENDRLPRIEDDPLVTLDEAISWARNILAIIGAIAVSAAIGLHHSGFFTWLFHLKG